MTTTTATTITTIPLTELHESPFNPRKHFDAGALQELAEDIKAHGRILQPLLVRPRVPPLFADVPDSACGFELVFGHRRLRAAQLANLAEAPCMVQTMSDIEVKRAQISENLQRRDVHPIEEAESFQALIDEHGETADSIAQQTGKSRSYVYGRLKLLQACPEIRKACIEGQIDAEVALLIARLRHPKLQKSALGYIKGKALDLEDGGKQSFRRVKDLLNERFTLDLKKAPFPIEEDLLLAKAGNCLACPKRSGNAPEFEDITGEKKAHQWSLQNLGADVCTDPDCFAEKKVTFFKREADALRDQNQTVIDGNRARALVGADGEIKGGYVAAADAKEQLAKARRNAQRDSSIVPPLIVTIQDPRTGKTFKAIKASELVAAGVDEAVTKSSPHAEYNRRQAEQNRKDQEAYKEECRARSALLAHVRAATASAPRQHFDTSLIATAMVENVSHQDKACLAELWQCVDEDELLAKIPTLSHRSMNQLLMDCALISNVRPSGPWNIGNQPTTLIEAANHYGINIESARADLTPPARPIPWITPASEESDQAEGAENEPPAAKPAARPKVRYINDKTGETWSGRGLQPKWLKAAISGGQRLEEFDTQANQTQGELAEQ